MDFVGERYYKLNRILLLCLGLWPSRTSALKRTQIIFFQTLFISFLVCQCNNFLVKQYSINHFIKIFVFIIINCIYVIKYNACLLLTDDIKYIFDRIQYDWNMLKAQEELEMIRSYADNVKLYTIFFIFLSTSASLGLLILLCIPCILDVIVPMNESRPRQQLIIMEYFVDEERYFFAILIHIIVNYYVGCMTITAVATILIAYVLHACAMFKIASYRIEQIFDENILQMPKDIKQYILYEKLIHAVYVHRRAVDLANIMTNSFATFYFVLIGFAVVSTSLSFLNVSVNAINAKEHNIIYSKEFFNAVESLNVLELLVYGFLILIHLYYMFLANYVGQNVIDSSVNICQATYNTQWYAAPLWMQKLILFIMQRSNKQCVLKAGGLFDASLEGFAMLMSMSISYVMVLQSVGTQRKPLEEL